jgi:hypothetical protein
MIKFALGGNIFGVSLYMVFVIVYRDGEDVMISIKYRNSECTLQIASSLLPVNPEVLRVEGSTFTEVRVDAVGFKF